MNDSLNGCKGILVAMLIAIPLWCLVCLVLYVAASGVCWVQMAGGC